MAPFATARRAAATLAPLWLLALGACPSPSWTQGARDAAEAAAEAPADAAALARAGELAFLVDADPARAAELLARAFDATDPGRPEAQRAALALAYTAEAAARPALAAERLSAALAAAADPAHAEALARATGALWGHVEGAHADDSPAVRALSAVASRAGAAWEPARAEAHRQLVAAARLRGAAAARVATSAAGVLVDWRMSAPWGDVPERDLLRPLGPEARPLAATERTGHGLESAPRPTWRGRFSDGEATFFELVNDPGVGFAEATLAIPPGASRDLVLRLETNRPAVVFANGAPVLTLDRFRSAGPFEGRVGLRVAPGALRLTVKLATADGRGYFQARLATLTGEPLALEPAEPASATAPVTAFAPPPDLAAAPTPLPAADGAAFFRALAALDAHLERPRRDLVAARDLLGRLRAARPGHPALGLEAARLALLDPLLPDAAQRRATRDAWEATLARWPDNLVALRGLAGLEATEDRQDGALTYLRRAAEARPDDPFTTLELARHARSRGWEAEALGFARALGPAVGLTPRVGQELVDLFGAYGYMVDARAAAERLEALFPGAAALALAELDSGAGDPAAAARRLLAAFADAPERHDLLRGALAALRAAGDLAGAREALAGFLADRPQDPWALAERVRVALQAEDRPAALAAIAAALVVHPDFAPLESLGAWLAGQPEAFDLIGDGRAIVRRFLDGVAPDRRAEVAGLPVVTLFERRALDVRADGSTVELVHRVQLVQTRSGADSLGDFKPPRGARLLAARTLKADGRALWPERTRGKEALSFPDLESGDAIETAWVERSEVSPADGGYLSAFVFGAWDTPILELHAEVRAAPGVALRWRTFGGAPAPDAAEEGPSGTWLRWSADGLAAVPREPLAVGARSFFPFVDLFVAAPGADDAAAWRSIAASYAGRLARLVRPGAALGGLAARLAREAPAEAERARAAFAWVRDELEDTERFNAFETPAETAVAETKGSRVLVLRALADALGISAEIALCAPERDGVPEDADAPTPNPNRFFYPLVRLGAGPGAAWVDPSRPLAPFGALPAELDGARCLAFERLVEGGEPPLVLLPKASEAEAARATWRFSAELAIAPSGAAQGTLSGEGWGPATSGLRHAWKNADEARRRLIWQQWAVTLVPGAGVTSDRVSAAEDAERPVRWELGFAVDGFATPDAEGLVVGRVLKSLAGSDLASAPELAQLATLPARRTPLRVPPHREASRVVLVAPAGYAWTATPPPCDLRHGGHRFVQRVEVEGARLVVEREVVLQADRVAPADYPAFRATLQEVVQAFEARARATRAVAAR